MVKGYVVILPGFVKVWLMMFASKSKATSSKCHTLTNTLNNNNLLCQVLDSAWNVMLLQNADKCFSKYHEL